MEGTVTISLTDFEGMKAAVTLEAQKLNEWTEFLEVMDSLESKEKFLRYLADNPDAKIGTTLFEQFKIWKWKP
jgi:hypothetical protein